MAPGEMEPIGLMCSCWQDFISPASGTTLGLSGTRKLVEMSEFTSLLGVIMFFRKDPPQTEGRRHADPLIKTSPGNEGCKSPGLPSCGSQATRSVHFSRKRTLYRTG